MAIKRGILPSGNWKIGTYDAAIAFGNTEFRDLGELTAAPYTFNVERAVLPSGNSRQGGNAEVYERISEVFVDLDLRHATPENVALGLRGDATALTAVAITGEAHVLRAGGFVPADRIIDETVAPVLKKGATVIDTDDYTVSAGGITFVAAPATVGVADGDAITFDYTPVASYDIETLVNDAPEVRLFYDGYARNLGKSRTARIYRAQPSLVSSLENVTTGNEYLLLKIRFEILEDPSITDSGLSKFMKLTEPVPNA
jgi:hypothetical protein